jgi:transaldolase
MKATQLLHNLGQSLWLDGVTRDSLNQGILDKYIAELSVTGLASDPAIFNQAIRDSTAYDCAIRTELANGKSGEQLFFNLAIEDIVRSADLFRPIFNQTNGVDGWVSLDVSPLPAYDMTGAFAMARKLYNCAARPNVFIKIPGTKEGLPVIEEVIFAGVPVNMTFLFSREQYVAAAGAFIRGIERRIDAGLNPHVASVASIFISHWDAAVAGKVPPKLNNQLGIAMANRIYKAYGNLLASPRWSHTYNVGARPQRLLWTSTGTKNPLASDIMYVKALAAPFTVNAMPEPTLKALADHCELGSIMSPDGGNCEEIIGEFIKAGVKVDILATQLQEEGVNSFAKSWTNLMTSLDSKSRALATTSLEFSTETA